MKPDDSQRDTDLSEHPDGPPDKDADTTPDEGNEGPQEAEVEDVDLDDLPDPESEPSVGEQGVEV